jgi:hypothetical protein
VFNYFFKNFAASVVDIFSFRILIPTFFHSGSRILHEKRNANLFFFLRSQERNLSLSHTGSQNDLGSGKNSSRIQGVKKHRIPDPDPQHWLPSLDEIEKCGMESTGTGISIHASPYILITISDSIIPVSRMVYISFTSSYWARSCLYSS